MCDDLYLRTLKGALVGGGSRKVLQAFCRIFSSFLLFLRAFSNKIGKYRYPLPRLGRLLEQISFRKRIREVGGEVRRSVGVYAFAIAVRFLLTGARIYTHGVIYAPAIGILEVRSFLRPP